VRITTDLAIVNGLGSGRGASREWPVTLPQPLARAVGESEEVAMNFLRGKSGISSVEWLLLGVIIVAVLGGTLLALTGSLRTKFEDINNDL
jgi:Flp pilus assembly pilin Flp